ncbi:hypothetical protein AQF52_7932 [Streptomyces venezuelae]|nr:hypothetical protein AQF52_7932 [Streptomyces venezuelae]CUM35734.1 hypothetical protein BN2537_433 [Streptomyces venezuelae]
MGDGPDPGAGGPGGGDAGYGPPGGRVAPGRGLPDPRGTARGGGAGRVDEAIDLLLATERVSAWEPVEVLARHGRGAEGVAGMPSLARERETSRW